MEPNQKNSPAAIRSTVRQRYGTIAENSKADSASGCGCDSDGRPCCSPSDPRQLETFSNHYDDPNAAELPAEITNMSLGCGDPVTLASLQPGQTVLDLGSGGGIDCFLAAKKVGPSGKAIGVDMTPAMVERARANKTKMDLENVDFRLGEIEHIPAANSTVDVIISNCVINLSPNKRQVFREAYRVLRPGGKLAVSDIVTDSELPDTLQHNLSAWADCIAGALEVQDYIAAIKTAGFIDVAVTKMTWDEEILESAMEQIDQNKQKNKSPSVQASSGETSSWAETIFSAKITAYKPG